MLQQKITLSGNIETTIQGYEKLLAFYNECKIHTNCEIQIDLSALKWIDANLCGLWLLILEDLKHSNNLIFDIPQEYWLTNQHIYPNNFNILCRNNFIEMIYDLGLTPNDERKSTIQLRKFDVNQEEDFLDYIKYNFLSHRGCGIANNAKIRLQNAYSELFINYKEHAKTEKHVYLCGQYFPKNDTLSFSISDLGVGFLENIKNFNTEIIDAEKAIRWALAKGNTTKKNNEGGFGLNIILNFCKEHKGILIIISDGCYFEINFRNAELKLNIKNCNTILKGVTIHLLFSIFL